MSWYALALGSVFLNAIVSTLSKVILSGKHKIDYYSMAFLVSLTTTVTLAIYLSLTKFTVPPIGTFKILFIINITAGVIGFLTYQKGLSKLGVGEFTILMTTRQIVTWFASILLLSAGLTLLQGIGSILILAALVIVFLNRKTFKNNSQSGMFWTLLTAVIYGLAFIVDLLIYRKSDPASFLFIAFTAQVILLPFFKPNVLGSVKYFIQARRSLALISVGILTAAANVMLFKALKVANNAPLVSGLVQLQIIASVVFGIVFLHERKSIRSKLVGAGLATLGAILMVAKI